MARYTGPKNKIARREGIDLGLKTVGTKAHANLLKRLNVPPGQHGPKGRKKQSEFRLQLREKQKVKAIYGILERQFKKIFQIARKVKGNTGDAFLELLERRLDNVVYRLGFAPTRASARQIVNHGHVMVDGKKVNIPSYVVSSNSVILLREKALNIPAVKKQLEDKTYKPPAWLERQGPSGKVLRFPIREDITDDINTQLIIEYYSR